jgi:hypothetical protein
LGDLEHLVPLAFVRLGDESSGVSILDEIATRTGRPVSRGLRQLQVSRETLVRMWDHIEAGLDREGS